MHHGVDSLKHILVAFRRWVIAPEDPSRPFESCLGNRFRGSHMIMPLQADREVSIGKNRFGIVGAEDPFSSSHGVAVEPSASSVLSSCPGPGEDPTGLQVSRWSGPRTLCAGERRRVPFGIRVFIERHQGRRVGAKQSVRCSGPNNFSAMGRREFDLRFRVICGEARCARRVRAWRVGCSAPGNSLVGS